MKRCIALLVATLVCVGTSTAFAGEPAGGISDSGLAAMGLSGMKVVSDEEGAQVRGTGAYVFGQSIVNAQSYVFGSGGTQFSQAGGTNGYNAYFDNFATGSNNSWGLSISGIGGNINLGPLNVNGFIINGSAVIAGGSSTAWGF